MYQNTFKLCELEKAAEGPTVGLHPFQPGVCSQRRNHHVSEHLQEPGPFLQYLSFSSSTEPLSDTQSLL